MGTAFARVSPMPEVYKRAAAYGMRGEPVDGMDVLKVYEAVKDCAAYCRAGKGPVLLEANTYRFRGHSMSDPATYRTKTEVEQERKGDPIPKLRQFAVEQMKIPEAEFEAIDAEVKAKVRRGGEVRRRVARAVAGRAPRGHLRRARRCRT